MQKVVRVPVSVKGTANLLPGQEYLIGERAIAYPTKGRKTVRYVAAVSPSSGVAAGRGWIKELGGGICPMGVGFHSLSSDFRDTSHLVWVAVRTKVISRIVDR